ncbi:hypothetical protein CYY_005366 [Polysphondylium violaceum]|uniref:CHE group protein n=1 Tax=Polysphondylium violaceum TaxID=133409 RepID=A0A8J4PT15_9MYCE|nr:hypothetical protein CYY_005366 [Polysphondylium violaceum]
MNDDELQQQEEQQDENVDIEEEEDEEEDINTGFSTIDTSAINTPGTTTTTTTSVNGEVDEGDDEGDDYYEEEDEGQGDNGGQGEEGEDEEMDEDDVDDEEMDDDEDEEEEEEEEEENEVEVDDDVDDDDDDADDDDQTSKQSKHPKELTTEKESSNEIFKRNDPSDDYYIPIKLDIQSGVYKLGDYLLWNLNEQEITPEHYSKRLCIELDYPEWFEGLITNYINLAINHHRNIILEFRKNLPLLKQEIKECIVTIQIDLNVNQLYLKDQFEWDILGPNSPEIFARSLALDFGLPREFEGLIAYSIREQIQLHYYYLNDHFKNNGRFLGYANMRSQTLSHDQLVRNDYQTQLFTPSVSYRQPSKNQQSNHPLQAYLMQQTQLKNQQHQIQLQQIQQHQQQHLQQQQQQLHYLK